MRSNGSRVNFRKTPVSSNIYPWTPLTPDTYTVGVDIYDSAGNKVTREKMITVTDGASAPLQIAVFRAGYKKYYQRGETIALAARAEGGAVPYRYRFYVENSDGVTTVLRDYAYSNIYRWTPEVPGSYQVRVAVKDSTGTVVEEQREIILPLTVCNL